MARGRARRRSDDTGSRTVASWQPAADGSTPPRCGRWSLALLSLVPLVVVGCGVVAGEPTGPPPVEVAAAGQTQDVPGSGDIADDPAIWHHPEDPHRSVILGTNKDDAGGLHVYDGEGEQLQFLQVGALNNVDVRYALEGLGDYAAASNRSVGAVSLFAIDDGRLEAAGSFDVPGEPYGLCLGVHDDVHHAVVTYKSGELRQYALAVDGGEVSASEVRALQVGEQLEGCVADDENGLLYVGEEERGLYLYDLDPATGPDRAVVDRTGEDGNLAADVEGMALYRGEEGDGYLLISSQGASRIEVYRRGEGNRHLGAFHVVAGDGAGDVTETDGIEVTSAPVAEFDQGLLVIHDGERREADATNFKLVRWEDIATALELPQIAPERR
jgi:3-phytase